MPRRSRRTANPSAAALKALETQLNRMQDAPTAFKVWEQFLTPAERRRLGNDREAAYRFENARTVGIWARAKRVTFERAIVELAHKFGLPQGEYEWLMRELGELPATKRRATKQPAKPRWDKSRGELLCGNRVIRKVRGARVASNIIAVLDAFQAAHWRVRIDDPLPTPRDSQRLHKTIRSLNTGLRVISFSADGTGTGIRWKKR